LHELLAVERVLQPLAVIAPERPRPLRAAVALVEDVGVAGRALQVRAVRAGALGLLGRVAVLDGDERVGERGVEGTGLGLLGLAGLGARLEVAVDAVEGELGRGAVALAAVVDVAVLGRHDEA